PRSGQDRPAALAVRPPPRATAPARAPRTDAPTGVPTGAPARAAACLATAAPQSSTRYSPTTRDQVVLAPSASGGKLVLASTKTRMPLRAERYGPVTLQVSPVMPLAWMGTAVSLMTVTPSNADDDARDADVRMRPRPTPPATPAPP